MAEAPATQRRGLEMNQKFQAAITQKDDVCYVKLSGVIDEDNGLAGLVDQIPAGTAVINVGEVERINSCGVRDWVNWLGKIEKSNANVILVECSPAIVAQINLVHNFTGGGAVKSFFAPYFCPACDLEKVLLIEAAEMSSQGTPSAPTCRCDECDGVMDFDDMEESYFAFVSSGRKLAQNAKVDAVLKEMAPSDGKGERKIRSRIGITAVSGVGSQVPSSSPSLPSVPSLPSITRPGSQAGTGPGTPVPFGQTGTSPGSRPGSSPGSLPGATPSMAALDIAATTRHDLGSPSVSTGKPKLAMILVVALLLVAIGLLAYVVLFGQSKPKVKVHEMPQTLMEGGTSPSPLATAEPSRASPHRALPARLIAAGPRRAT
jgi:anti-anti-sigma regulatory factor